MATILGLDVDPKTARAVLLKTALRRSEVELYLAADIEPADTEEGRAENRRKAVQAILSRLAKPADKIITELSGEEVSIRKVSLPAKAAKKIGDLLPFELEGQVPFDPMESVLDHQPIGASDGMVHVLAAVAPKAKVAAHLDGMREVGVDPREVAVGSVALDGLIPLVPELAQPGPYCLIDIHHEGTDVCIVESGHCAFGRTLSVSTLDLDQGQQGRLEREVRQTLAAFRMEGGREPAGFFVCGTMATRNDVDGWLTRMFGFEVRVLPLPAAPGADDAVRPAYARAAALAGRALARGKHLDARQGEFASLQTATAIRRHVPLIAVCAVVVLCAFIFSSYARYSVLDARHAQLQDELADVTDEYLGTEARSPAQALRLLERGARGDDPMPEFDAYDALAAISASIPEEVVHDVRQLQIDLGDGEETGRFSLRGAVGSVSDTEVVLRALRDHRLVRRVGDEETRLQCFREIELGSTTATADDRQAYRIEGQIQCLPEGQDASEEEESRSSRRSRRSTRGN
ncbi:MAG: pilus assembly protein PilM [Sandaracinaceae bacterium]|nr:pilus assembly protein PilM [Sandaracinaceae bacterium]